MLRKPVRRSGSFRAALTAVCVGLVAVGCATTEASDTDDEPTGDGQTEQVEPLATDEEMDALFGQPIHAYMFTTAEDVTLQNAQQILVEECMRDLGFDFTRGEPQEVDPVSLAAFGPYHNYPGRWHVDAEYAAEHGFSHTEELLAQGQEEGHTGGGTPDDPRIDHRGSDYDDAVAALQGFPEDTVTPSGDPVPEWGCEGRAQGEIDEGVRLIGVEQA